MNCYFEADVSSSSATNSQDPEASAAADLQDQDVQRRQPLQQAQLEWPFRLEVQAAQAQDAASFAEQRLNRRLSRALSRASSGETNNLSEDLFLIPSGAPEGPKLPTEALVEVLITYGIGCPNGCHGKNVFSELQMGLENQFEGYGLLVIQGQEEPWVNCISVHVNNILIFGCQGRRPTVEQLCKEVQRALKGKRPRLIPYSKGIVCEYYGSCQSQRQNCKYRI